MIYIYRRAASTGALTLAEALGGRRYRALQMPIERKVRPNDVVICWGERLEPIPNVRILNGVPFRNKLQDAQRLREAGVATIEVSMTRPMLAALPVVPVIDPAVAIWEKAQTLANDFTQVQLSRNQVLIDGIEHMYLTFNALQQALRDPAPTPAAQASLGPDLNWVGRLVHHVGGNDLLNPPPRPDFWVKKEDIVREFRVHSFKGRSIRAGMKVHRPGIAIPHEWIRSWDGGWRISYDGASVRQRHRDIAHAAIEALGLDFGAVDIAERRDGNVFVLEVNRAPGLEGGTITVYANAIRAWLGGM